MYMKFTVKISLKCQKWKKVSPTTKLNLLVALLEHSPGTHRFSY